MSGHVPRPPGQGQDPPARHLKLVPTDPPPKRRNRKRPPVFSPTETLRLRAALRSAKTLFGSYACAADAMHVLFETLTGQASGRIPVTADVALRLARALGKPLESLYRAPTAASTCPTCGRRS